MVSNNKLRAILLLLILSTSQATEITPYEDLHTAVVGMYQPNKTLKANMDVIMSIFCPESVFCACAGDKYEACKQQKVFQNMTGRNQLMPPVHMDILNGCCSPCSCEPTCYEKQKCCREMPRRSLKATGVRELIRQCMRSTYVVTNKIPVPASHTQSYFMITDCFYSDYSFEVANACKSPDNRNLTQILPVLSRTTGRIYRNVFCARCSNDTDIDYWQTLVQVSGLHPRSNIIFSFDSENIFEMTGKFTIVFLPPDAYDENDLCVPSDLVRATCNKGPTHQKTPNYDFIENACLMDFPEYTQSSFYIHNTNYKNIFCLFCSVHSWLKPSDDTCVEEKQLRTVNGYLILLKVPGKHADHKETGNGDTEDRCHCTEWYDEEEDVCHKVICPQGDIYVNCQCQKAVLKVSGLSVDTRFEILPQTTLPVDLTNERFIAKLLKGVSKFLASLSGGLKIKHFIVFICYRNLKPVYYLVSQIIVNFGYDTRDIVKIIFESLETEKVMKVGKLHTNIRLGSYLDVQYDFYNNTHEPKLEHTSYLDVVGFYQPAVIKSLRFLLYSLPLQKLIYCKQIVLSSNDVMMLEACGNSSEEAARQIQYVYNDEISTMCLEDFRRILRPNGSSASGSLVLAFMSTFVDAMVLNIILETGLFI